MKDIRTGIMIAVPAAVALVSLIWFLRRKSNKKDRGPGTGRDSNTSPSTPSTLKHDKPEKTQVHAQSVLRGNQGITLTQRKIPETTKQEYGDYSQRSQTLSTKPSGIGDSSSSRNPTALNSSQENTVEELVQSAIGIGIKEASQTLSDSGGGDIVTEKIVQDTMIAASTAPTYHAQPRSSHHVSSVGGGNKNNNNRSQALSLDPSSLFSPSNVECVVDTPPTSVPNSSSQQSSVDLDLVKVERSSISCDDLNFSAQVATHVAKEQESISEQNDSTDNAMSKVQSSEKDWAEMADQPKQLDEPSTNSVSPGCDNNSVGSNDSGRGGSEQDANTHPNENLIHFDFNIPSDLCGRLIGKQGKNINFIKSKSGANVSILNNPFTPEFRICQVIGSQSEVDEALSLIRQKFPLNSHPGLTMAPLNLPIPSQVEAQPVIVPEGVQLSLPEGVTVDVYVSAIVNAGHVFVQQPTHRSFMSLEKLNHFLKSLYGQDSTIPSVPEPVECGVICVCENDGEWYRTMITSSVDENGECQVKFVDYGGYASLPISSLKQIRTDLMRLPFQAVECFMANVSPLSGENYFSDVATYSLSERTQLKLLKCQVVARSEDGTPFIHLYDINPTANTALMLNRSLVEDSLVQWVEIL